MRFFSTFPKLKVILVAGRNLVDPRSGLPGASIPTKAVQFERGLYETEDPDLIRMMLGKIVDHSERGLRQTFSVVQDGPAAQAEYEAYVDDLEQGLDESEGGEGSSVPQGQKQSIQELYGLISDLTGQVATLTATLAKKSTGAPAAKPKKSVAKKSTPPVPPTS